MENSFATTFDGNDKTISNLFINNTDGNSSAYIGLFGFIGQQGDVKNLGLLNAKVTGGGSLGALAGGLWGSVTDCYAEGSSVEATGSSVGLGHAGGLIGHVIVGRVTGSYAKVNVTGSTAGGLVGSVLGRGIITASYATGDVIARGSAGGLVGASSGSGQNPSTVAITASYATGSVSGSYHTGGLVGSNRNGATIAASYAMGTVRSIPWPHKPAGLTNNGEVSPITGLPESNEGKVSGSYWDIGGTGVSATSSGGTGKTTTELQSPTSNTGIYSAWSASQWDFGTAREYPAVKHNGKLVPGQRETSIRSDNINAPVVGEPVVAGLNVTGATSTAWQWQSSSGGAAWTDIASSTAATYIPVAADVGKHLRAKVTFTAAGRSRTVNTFNTAKVVSSPGAAASDVSSFVPVVGEKIRLSLSAAGASSPGVWRWKRCDDAAMLTGCKFVVSSEPANNAYTEYTPAAGTDTDVGKYLQAYVYYADSGNGNAWTRGKTPVLGPVAAASATAPSVSASP